MTYEGKQEPVAEALTYGQKLIAEAIEHHFGARNGHYDEDVDDTTVHDAWEAFDALTCPSEQTVTEAMVEAGLEYYAEGGCGGLADHERREVVEAIIEAALKSAR